MNQNRDPELQALLDKQAITELVTSYCRACDRRDVEAIRALYHSDSRDDHGSFYEGRGMDYVNRIATMWALNETMQHHMTMINIRVDGDYAESEAYGLHFMQSRTETGLEDNIVGSRFLDKYERRAGLWKFSHRTHIIDWSVLSKPSQLCVAGPMFAGSLRAGKDESDPSYKFFRLFKRGT
jgi:hypothetical protein